MLAILAVLVFFMFRNSRKRQKDQAELQTKMVPGAEVMTSFGLYGTLVSVDDEKVTADIEVAPGTVVRVHRQTLSKVVEDTEVTDAEVEDTESTVGTDAPVLNDAPVVDDAPRPASDVKKTDD
ncbi:MULTISPECIES: preprotein translocase subunit YajC [unclassified Diaminobutyricimonas]|uniref:preprotein translocase subunit YajC n=1 Tax=unclassified Diaminobutyricimonas TaxID=2643261 RepID=UPI001E60BD6C|nr:MULTISPECIES: preprotein translocase subunit YajC [unclassified Diaminobutyricimonas]